jgi:hypothetical protein
VNRPIHFDLEVLYETTFTTACGSSAAKNVTTDEARVTCRRCLRALGYDAVPADQLTECQPDPIRRAA